MLLTPVCTNGFASMAEDFEVAQCLNTPTCQAHLCHEDVY